MQHGCYFFDLLHSYDHYVARTPKLIFGGTLTALGAIFGTPVGSVGGPTVFMVDTKQYETLCWVRKSGHEIVTPYTNK